MEMNRTQGSLTLFSGKFVGVAAFSVADLRAQKTCCVPFILGPLLYDLQKWLAAFSHENPVTPLPNFST